MYTLVVMTGMRRSSSASQACTTAHSFIRATFVDGRLPRRADGPGAGVRTEPYWTRAVVGGVERDVLAQLFQRRVLSYTPATPPALRSKWATSASTTTPGVTARRPG